MFYKPPERRPRPEIPTQSSPLFITPRKRPALKSYRSLSKPHPPTFVHQDPRILNRAQSVDPWSVYRINPARRHGNRSHTLDRSHHRLTVSNEDVSRELSPMNETHSRGRRRDRRVLALADSVSSLPSNNRNYSLDSSQTFIPSRHKRVNVRPSLTRRGTAMVLLSLWFFVSLGPGPDPLQPATDLVPTSSPVPLGTQHLAPADTSEPSLKKISIDPFSLRHPVLLFDSTQTMLFRHRHRFRHGRGSPFKGSVLIGRVFAWICTVLYMTSRIPQIWTNFKHRSVQGLSVLLFVLAFLANLLYSISVLANPKAAGPDQAEYLSESIPFLLGSGGTLIFDMVIIIQFWMWHDRPVTTPDPV